MHVIADAVGLPVKLQCLRRPVQGLGVPEQPVFPRPAWMSVAAYEAFPNCLEVREMRVRGKILVTTLTLQEASKNELGKLFADRWHVEVDLRHLKTTLGMEALKCKTAEMCEKALWVYFLETVKNSV